MNANGWSRKWNKIIAAWSMISVVYTFESCQSRDNRTSYERQRMLAERSPFCFPCGHRTCAEENVLILVLIFVCIYTEYHLDTAYILRANQYYILRIFMTSHKDTVMRTWNSKPQSHNLCLVVRNIFSTCVLYQSFEWYWVIVGCGRLTSC